ncbi:MAG: roadblock/LC7 domain-containing protein [Planctomycetes bacterium]|nr:roadblock/LC7 domain-containing protein [Planctomycetota bacterium]
MNAVRSILEQLRQSQGVKGCAMVTQDGIVIDAQLSDATSSDVVAGLTSFLVSNTRRALAEGGLGNFRQITMTCTHGKLVVVDLGQSCLAVLTDQFVKLESCLAAIEDASVRLVRASSIHV